MADPAAPVPTAADADDLSSELEVNLVDPNEELAALVTQVSELSKLAVDLSERCIDLNDSVVSKLALSVTRHCLNIREEIPRVVRLKVDAAVSEIRPHRIYLRGVAPTPEELDAEFPAGRGDDQAWYVVWVGRQPGLFGTPEEANEQVNSLPNGSRRKIVGRIPALAYYRHKYETNKVMRLDLVPN